MPDVIEVKGSIILSDRYYTSSDEWVKFENDNARVGITDYAQRQLKDIVGIELCEPGKKVKQGEIIATIDSIKATADVYAPLTGSIVNVNKKLLDNPELMNNDPYGEGWIAIVSPSSPEGEKKNLLTPEEYAKLLEKR